MAGELDLFTSSGEDLDKIGDILQVPPRFVRMRSVEQLEGYVDDLFFGGYCESDEKFRKRILEEISDTDQNKNRV